MVDVKKINLFPTTIYSFKSEITDEQNEEMLDYIYDKFENKYIDVKTNEGLPFGLEQGEDNLHREPCFTPLVEWSFKKSFFVVKIILFSSGKLSLLAPKYCFNPIKKLPFFNS